MVYPVISITRQYYIISFESCHSNLRIVLYPFEPHFTGLWGSKRGSKSSRGVQFGVQTSELFAFRKRNFGRDDRLDAFAHEVGKCKAVIFLTLSSQLRVHVGYYKLLFRGRFHLPATNGSKPLKIKQLWLEGKPSRS